MIDGNKLIEAIQALQQGGSQPPVQNDRRGKTRVAVVLDSSGSMQSIRNDIIGAFNANNTSIRDGAKASGTETFVTLVVFGESVQPVNVKFENQSVSALSDLDERSYVPQSGTPMYDGIGRAIASLKAAKTGEDDEAFLVNIFTDGYENASREWNGVMLSNEIKALQESGKWTFTVAGANIDLTALAGTLNIPIHNTIQFAPTTHGTQVMSHQHQHGNAQYFAARGVGMTQSAAFYGDTELGGNHGVNPQYPLGKPATIGKSPEVQSIIDALTTQEPPKPVKRNRSPRRVLSKA